MNNVPPVKLFRNGKVCQSVVDILKANSRLPSSIVGDMWAGVSANHIAQERVLEMCNKYGFETIKTSMEAIIQRGRDETKIALETLPKGTFSADIYLDSHDPFPMHCTITDSEFILDLTHAPEQTNTPYNVGHEGIYAAAQIVFKALVAPHTPANEGNYEPIKIQTKEGSIFHPIHPAPQGLNFENRMIYFDALLAIAIQIAPDKFGAGHFSSICGTFINGPHSQTKEQISLVEPQVGGWGASQKQDGACAMFSASHGDTFNCPAEISEARYGLLIEELALNPCQSGQGKFRGGKGIQMTYRVCTDGLKLTLAYSKGQKTTWGYAEGRHGGNNYLLIRYADGHEERLNYGSNISVNTGDKITIFTANGGGYGNCKHRDKNMVAHDLKNEYITVDTAQSIYNAF